LTDEVLTCFPANARFFRPTDPRWKCSKTWIHLVP